MVELTGKEASEIEQELTGVIFRNIGDVDPVRLDIESFSPESYSPVTADEFLSGNVRQKLRVIRTISDRLTAAGKTDMAERLAPSIAALEKVQPKDLAASEIDVRLGATWLPAQTVQEFMAELFRMG